ncbi:uncharacterized protein (TIGR02679 family) [Rhodococcus sp. OK611]|uniref:TIGR02679 family protein n=1 Tax=Rhodococcus sp. OK270 TaxID=1882814 RepID=UPI000BD1F739|nr:TIGR02679 family protein [Rhodococcus sp. OK270]PTR45428.1 uncharacterized protein (TIGR02679 family) [Rhodococcus sp. OK611]SNX88978.1 TIGR02679 family protein [Rhodococcus sp. OK270]
MGRWEGTPELEVLLGAARKSLEGNWLRVEGPINVHASPDAPNLYQLFPAIRGGRPQRSKTFKVELVELDEWLRRPLNGGRSLLDTLAPLRNLKLDRAESEAYRDKAEREVRDILGDGAYEPWLEWLRKRGALTRYAQTRVLLDAARVLTRLPAAGISLTELAEAATGNTKALSKGPIEGLVLRALATESAEPYPDSAEQRRALWESNGVAPDTLSSQVIGLGLRSRDDHFVGRWMNACADAGEPFVVTLDHLIRHSVKLTGAPVYVCENPAVLAAVGRSLGSRAPAMICTQGLPSAAARRLLDAVPGPIHWRGDFDWTGIRTTADAMKRYRATPWLMDAATYREALGRGMSEKFKDKDRPCPSPWDPDLSVAMLDEGTAVMEERIIPELLKDLSVRGAP